MINRLIILSAVITSAAGCQHARSFLHMNSDSPSPFMGLELSVDASDASDAESNRHDIKTVSTAGIKADSERLASAANVIPNQQKTNRERFVSTSEVMETSANLRYSLPAVDLNSGSTDANEVDDIIHRFSGS